MNTIATLALMLPLSNGFGGTKPNCAPCDRPVAPIPYGPNINAGQPCPPLGPPSQVLAAKITVPAGTRITAFPGSDGAKTYQTSALFGLRPGYVYRFEIAGFDKGEGVLYPEIEVRGSLVLRPGMVMMDHYAGIAFSARDLERAAAGAMITKVIYLEDPTKAVPVKTTADTPYESPDDRFEDAVKFAMENGRLVMVMRLGNRKPTAEMLNAVAIPNTILLPGEQELAAPPVPGPLAWCGVNLFDPILGPKFPFEECFTDGGDTGPRLGVRDSGILGGLTPTDTAAEFTVGDKKRVTTSNTVCICAPRFLVRRVEMGANGLQTAQRPEAGLQRTPPSVIAQKSAPVLVLARERTMFLRTFIHPQSVRADTGVGVVTHDVGLKAVFQLESVRVVKAYVEPDEVQNADDFLLTKEVDPKENVKVGDTVTFTLRYRNHTGKPVSDVVLSDSLSGRLEYVPGTSESDRPMNVTTTANEAGSVVMRFELPGTLQSGQGGVIRFKAKVR